MPALAHHAAHLSGDCYIAAAGILEKDEEGFFVVATEHEKLQSALNVMDFAKAILKQSKLVRGEGRMTGALQGSVFGVIGIERATLEQADDQSRGNSMSRI